MNSGTLPLHFGIVEDNNDPLKLGRVRVRVYGQHSENKSDIPTEDLPWASVTVNVIESQTGTSQVIPVGATALIFFTDVLNLQEPIVIGVLSGTGDLHKTVTGDFKKSTSVITTNLFSEPSSPYAPVYPHNTAISQGNSFIEIDGTDGAERVQLHHKSGSFSEYHPKGDHVQKIVGKDYEIILDDKNLFVKGNLNISVNGDSNIEVAGDVDIKSGKKLNLSAADNVTITGKEIHLNTGGGDSVSEVSVPDSGEVGSGGNAITVSPTEPENPSENDLWFDSSDNNRGYVYDGDNWNSVTSNDTITDDEIFVNQTQTITSTTEPDYYTDGPFSNGSIWSNPTDDSRRIWNNVTQVWATTDSVDFGKSIISSGLNTSISDGLLVVFNGSSLPLGANEGDLWFRSDVNSVYRLKKNRWINYNSTLLNDTFNTLIDESQIDNFKVHFASTEPSNGISGLNDIWVNGASYSQYDGLVWNSFTNEDFNKSLQVVAFDTSVRDGKIRVLFSPSEPTQNVDEGDIWVDVSADPETNQPRNTASTWDSVAWVPINDPAIEQGLVSAARFEEIQDGQIVVFFDTNEPTSINSSPAPKIGDVWFDISDNIITDSNNYSTGSNAFAPNTPNTTTVPRFDQYRFNGDAWVPIENYKISDVSAKLDVETTIRENQSGALAQQIITVGTSVDENTATVQETISSIDGLVGQYGISFDNNGVVTGFNILTDYDSEIEVTVGDDENYRIGEQVYIGATLATSTFSGTVVSWNRNTNKVKIVSESGSYTSNQSLIGNTSGTTRNTIGRIERQDFGTTVKFDTTNFIVVDTASGNESSPFSIRNGVVYVGEVDTETPQITYIGDFANAPATTFNLNSIYKNTSDNNTYVLEDVGGIPTWNLFLEKGTDGSDGSDGIAGPSGADGQTLYTWIAYADSADGTVGFAQTPAGKSYFGIAYNNPSQTESSNPVDYNWSLIKGSDGANGLDGQDGQDGADGLEGPAGVDGQPTYTWIAYADSADGTVNFTIGAGGSRSYIGIAHNQNTSTESTNETLYNWSLIKGDDGQDGIQGPAGADGQPTYTWIKYADDINGSGLTNLPAGKNYIGIAYNKNTAIESNTASDYTWALIKGDTGADGADGIQGPAGVDGQPTYTWIKYADDINGVGLSNSSTNKNYIGIAYNKNTAIESNTASDYEFSLFKGSDGSDGSDGIRGSKTFYAVTTGSTWSNSVANSAISTQSFTKIINDIVTLYNTSAGFSETRSWDGTAWIPVTQVIDGNLVVQGTIGADRIVAGTTFTQSLYIGGSNLELDGGENRIVVTDGATERVIIGDTNGAGAYGIIIKDSSGNDIINQSGLQLNDTTLLNGNPLFTDLSDFFDQIETFEVSAENSAEQAVNVTITTLPSTFKYADEFFSYQSSGAPETLVGISAQSDVTLFQDPIEGYGVRTDVERYVTAKGALPYIVNNRYRLTARIRASSIPSTGVVRLHMRNLVQDYATTIATNIKTFGLGTWVNNDVLDVDFELTANQANYDNGARWLRPQVLFNYISGTGGGDGEYEIFKLEFRNITAEYNAEVSATNSLASANISTTQANASLAARNESEQFKNDAEIFKNDAATSATSATASAAIATTESGVVASVRKRINLINKGVDNAGFESGSIGQAGIPDGWSGGAYDLTAFNEPLGYISSDGGGEYDSLIGYGSTTTNAGRWWYISKYFLADAGQGFKTKMRAWIGDTDFVTITEGQNVDFIDEDDLITVYVWYDDNGQVLNRSSHSGASSTHWQNNGARMIPNMWNAYEGISYVTAPPNTAYVEVRIVGVDFNSAIVAGDRSDYETYSTGNAHVKIDDVEFFVNSGSVSEVQPMTLDTAQSAFAAATSETNALAYQNAAGQSAANASQSETLVAEAVGTANIIARDSFPSTFQNNVEYFSHNVTGSPDILPTVTDIFNISEINNATDGWGIRLSAGEEYVTHKAALPIIVGDTYRLRVKMKEIVTPTSGNVRLIIRGSAVDFTTTTQAANTSDLTLTNTGEWYELTWTATQSHYNSHKWLRGEVRFNYISGGAFGDGVYELYNFEFENISAQHNAENSQALAAINASNAVSAATNASESAASAESYFQLIAKTNFNEILLRPDENQNDWLIAASINAADNDYSNGQKAFDPLPSDVSVEIVNDVPEIVFDGLEKTFFTRATLPYTPTKVKFYRISCQIKYDRASSNTTSRLLLGAWYLDEDYSNAGTVESEDLVSRTANGLNWTDIEWLFAASLDPISGWSHIADNDVDPEKLKLIRFGGQAVYNNGDGKMRLRNFAVEDVSEAVVFDGTNYVFLEDRVSTNEASVAVNATAISENTGRLQAHWSVETSVAGAQSFITAQADLTQGGVASSSVAIGATSFQVFNSVDGEFQKAMDVVGTTSTFYGDINALGAMRFGARRIPVALQSFQIAGLQDGDSFTFGGDLSNIPAYTIDTTGLAPLTSGQSYDVALENLTPTGATLRAKVTTSGTTTTVTSSGSTNGTGAEPDEVLHKSSANDATNGNYTFNINFQAFYFEEEPPFSGAFVNFEFFVRPTGGTWTSIGTQFWNDFDDTSDGIQTANASFIKNYANAIGQNSDQEFGVSILNPASGEQVNNFTVTYQTTSQSGTSSATPSGQTTVVTILPQNS